MSASVATASKVSLSSVPTAGSPNPHPKQQPSTTTTAKPSMAQGPPRKYVPIRPSFRPLLPKPCTTAASSSSQAALPQVSIGLRKSTTLALDTAGPKQLLGKKASSLTSTKASKAKVAKSTKTRKGSASTAASAKKQTQKSNALRANTTTTKTIKNDNDTKNNEPLMTNTQDKTTNTTSDEALTQQQQQPQQPFAVMPFSVSPASLVTSATLGPADLASPASGSLFTTADMDNHMATGEDEDDLLAKAIRGLPRSASPAVSDPTSPLDLLDSLDIAAVAAVDGGMRAGASSPAPDLDSWAATQTADAILSASASDEFFWLSPTTTDTTTSEAAGFSSGGVSPASLDSFGLGSGSALSSPGTSLADFDDLYEDADMAYGLKPGATASTGFEGDEFCDFGYAGARDVDGFLDLGIEI